MAFPKASSEAFSLMRMLDDYEESVKSGRTFLSQKKSGQAHAAFGRATRISPLSSEALILMATASIHMNHYDQASNEAGLALKTDRHSTIALLLRGRAYYAMGDFEFAIRHFRACQNIDPDNAECGALLKRVSRLHQLLQRAQGQVQQGQWIAAASTYDQAVQVDASQAAFASFFLACQCECLLKANETELAIRVCEQAVQTDSENIHAWMLLGDAYASMEDYEAAVDCYTRAHNLHPAHPTIFAMLEMLTQRMGDPNRVDYYKILEVNENATTPEIKRSYRRLALRWHPDKHNNSRLASFKFRRVAEAYRILSNETLRAEYDRLRHGGGGASLSFSFSFGGGGGPPPEDDPSRMTYRMIMIHDVAGMLTQGIPKDETNLSPRQSSMEWGNDYRVSFVSEDLVGHNKYRFQGLTGQGVMGRQVTIIGFDEGGDDDQSHDDHMMFKPWRSQVVRSIIPTLGSFSIVVSNATHVGLSLSCSPCDLRSGLGSKDLQTGVLIAEGTNPANASSDSTTNTTSGVNW
eukprot:CAMPEP_0184669124 /NCGR_PEP_ID=MMETSP0308-20130426/75898_1 /TAXON_ID=38269 /ORGANISM="Gloeochaete witrockiana, Strain SAG 46.84" /LENGTH=520 /DNA_ID=CAMNT_0027115237 /DNA_START=366 /DNA_END=1925 /DNA_ORIENTATION=+